jgi:hypothetical protein
MSLEVKSNPDDGIDIPERILTPMTDEEGEYLCQGLAPWDEARSILAPHTYRPKSPTITTRTDQDNEKTVMK